MPGSVFFLIGKALKKLYEEALSEKTKYPHISWKCAYIIAKGRSYYAKRHYNICYGSEAKVPR